MFSCSSDGAILNWTVLENCLVATLITVIPFTRQIKSEVGVNYIVDETQITIPGSSSLAFFISKLLAAWSLLKSKHKPVLRHVVVQLLAITKV